METSLKTATQVDLKKFTWINKPNEFVLEDEVLTIQTEPETDLWQRTFYGFRNDNSPAFLTEVKNDFTFKVKTSFETRHLYDQCGILMYQDSKNWVKISVEHENEKIARLGSVVTNLGYSDWATTDIPAYVTEVWYRLSRKGQDFYIEYSSNGREYKQMRLFHMHVPIRKARIGVYACSPLKSSFKAEFSEFSIEPCHLKLH